MKIFNLIHSIVYYLYIIIIITTYWISGNDIDNIILFILIFNGFVLILNRFTIFDEKNKI